MDQSMKRRYSCPMSTCDFSKNSKKKFLRHFCNVHPNKSLFICECCLNQQTCVAVYKSFKKIKKHVNFVHHGSASKALHFSVYMNTLISKIQSKLANCEFKFDIHCTHHSCHFKTNVTDLFKRHIESHLEIVDNPDVNGTETRACSSTSSDNEMLKSSYNEGGKRHRDHRKRKSVSNILYSQGDVYSFLSKDEHKGLEFTHPSCHVNDKTHVFTTYNDEIVSQGDVQEKGLEFSLLQNDIEMERNAYPIVTTVDTSSEQQRTKGEPRECSICQKLRVNLRQHMLLHSDIKQYECLYCDYKAKRNTDLNIHLLSHSDVRGFVCAHCQKTFKGVSDLKKHKKVHAEKTLPCGFCGKNFRLKQHLDNHINFIHYKQVRSKSIVNTTATQPPLQSSPPSSSSSSHQE